MSWSNVKSSREDRVLWLRENEHLWSGADPYDVNRMKTLALAMKTAGLYASSTNLHDIALRLGPLIEAARGGKKRSGGVVEEI